MLIEVKECYLFREWRLQPGRLVGVTSVHYDFVKDTNDAVTNFGVVLSVDESLSITTVLVCEIEQRFNKHFINLQFFEGEINK